MCEFGEPKLFKCLENLLYDPVKRVCNWAYLVNCGQLVPQENVEEHIPVLPNPPYNPQPEEIYPGPPQSETQPPYNQYPPNPPSYTVHPPPLIENPDIPDYGETHEFYPGLIESIPNVFHCTKPEFYFAPHPRSCEKYFICENYRIHNHKCGEGIYWDYIFNQCDFPVKTFCYSDVSIGHIDHIIDPEQNPESDTISIEPPTAAPTTFSIECPGTQAFIAHPEECQKYFICIGGIPIVTSCPDKMAWAKELSQCNEDAWSQCFETNIVEA